MSQKCSQNGTSRITRAPGSQEQSLHIVSLLLKEWDGLAESLPWNVGLEWNLKDIFAFCNFSPVCPIHLFLCGQWDWWGGRKPVTHEESRQSIALINRNKILSSYLQNPSPATQPAAKRKCIPVMWETYLAAQEHQECQPISKEFQSDKWLNYRAIGKLVRGRQTVKAKPDEEAEIRI